MNRLHNYLIEENDRLKMENASLVNDIRDMCHQVGYLRGYIAGKEDAEIATEDDFEVLFDEEE